MGIFSIFKRKNKEEGVSKKESAIKRPDEKKRKDNMRAVLSNLMEKESVEKRSYKRKKVTEKESKSGFGILYGGDQN